MITSFLTGLLAILASSGGQHSRYRVAIGSVVIAFLVYGAGGQECQAGTAKFINGNWYCRAVDSISYTNFPGTGYYHRVVHMNTTTGECKTERHDYTGSLSPLNEELALHIRGPTWLKQLAVYMPEPALVKRDEDKRSHSHQHHHHGHRHHDYHINKAHSKRHAMVERAVGEAVTATINGETVAWNNKYGGDMDEKVNAQGEASHHGAEEMITATVNSHIASWTNDYGGPSAATPAQGASVDAALGEINTSQATTVAHQVQDTESSSIEAFAKEIAKILSTVATSTPTNLAAKASSIVSAQASRASAFFGNKAASTTSAKPTSPAPAKATSSASIKPPSQPSSTSSSSSTASKGAPSGSWRRQAYYNAAQGHSEGLVFLSHFGNAHALPGWGASLSYASHDAIYSVENPQILGNAMISDSSELVILSDKSCNDGKCGYTRPDGLAYHGFGGDHKIFLLEFGMPLTGETGFNADMPAIWLMNAAIALTSQYGENQDCSCWSSGCGELDCFEGLDAGNERLKSTLHMAPAGGSSDYFERPVNGSIKAAVVFYGRDQKVVIQVLDEIVAFAEVLTEGFINSVVAELPSPKKGSVFKLQMAV